MIPFRYFTNYVYHQVTAKTAHGLHSPLAYDLYKKVIHNTSPTKSTQLLELIRKDLEKNEGTLQVLDLGAGSHLTKGNTRKIGDIAKHALKPERLARLLYHLACWHKSSVIIELGTSLGLTSAYLAHALPSAKIISIEGSPEIALQARKVHKKANVNVEVLEGNFDDILPGVLKTLSTDNFMLYVDGNHQYEATLKYFEMGLNYAGEKSLFVFDDIHWSEGMEHAWEKIKENPIVTLSADIFFMGLAFTESTRAKQDFRLRFF